jgi:ribosome-binding protein aMBF1 (putative translation factor)
VIEDDEYPSVEVIRARMEAARAEQSERIREAADRRARGEKPTRTRTVGPVTRERLRKAATNHYARQDTDSKLRAARHERRWSRVELGQRANVGVATIRDAEERRPHAVAHLTWKRLADALGLAVEEIQP